MEALQCWAAIQQTAAEACLAFLATEAEKLVYAVHFKHNWMEGWVDEWSG